jgi:hypothetical protein
MCRCGHHPKTYLNTSPSLSQLTTHELMDQLEKWGYKTVKISDEGTGRIGITTNEALSRSQQDQLEACMPAGTRIIFTVSIKKAETVPPQLEKWYRDTQRYLK